MNHGQVEFGYSPHNLRFILKSVGITQVYAGEIVGKARSTFGRYLLDIDNPSHVSMSYRDWLTLLEKLSIPPQTFKVNRIQQHMSRQLIDSLEALPENSKVFVGARNGVNGRILTHLTDERSVQEFKAMMKDRFNTDGIACGDFQCFTIKVENLFEDFAQGLVKKIDAANEAVFGRIVEYDTDGVVTGFKAFFNRIISSQYDDYQGLSRDILRINTHFMKEFKSTTGYYRNPNFNDYQQYSEQYLSDINQVEILFSSALNTLVMYMVSEYYGSKKEYYRNNGHIADVIRDMKKHLMKLILVEFPCKPRLFDQYLITKAFDQPDEFNQIQDVLEYQVSSTEFARIIHDQLRKKDTYFDHGYYDVNRYELCLFDSCKLREYFDRLIKLFGILNLVSDMNDKLAISSENCNDPDAEQQVGAEFKFLLQFPSNLVVA